MDARSSVDPDLLLAQTSWVQALARRLVDDADLAEDVAQNTLLAALERPPRHAHNERSLRAWLARVVRSAAHVGRRSDARRRLREQIAARPERSDSTAEVVARASQLQLVVGALMELEEPYRSTLLLAYFEGLSSAEIAARTGVSGVAVRKRTSRGLAKLRARLDDEHGGDRQAWIRAFAPWLGIRASGAKAGLSVLGHLAAALLAAGAAGGFLLRLPAMFRGPQVAAAHPAGADSAGGPGQGPARRSRAGGPASQAAASGLLAVRVVAASGGRPLEGVDVEVGTPSGGTLVPPSHTGPGGWARFRVPAGQDLTVVARGADLDAPDARERIQPVVPDEPRLLTLVLATSFERLFSARVVDPDSGAPLEGVEVRRASARAGSFSRWSTAAPVIARSDTAGSFRVPVPAGSTLLQLDAPGRAGVLVDAVASGGTVELPRAAGILAAVGRASGALAATESPGAWEPVAGATVELLARATDLGGVGGTDSGATFVWTARSDAVGRVRIAGLPPNVPLAVCVTSASGNARPGALVLEPGRVRSVTWTLGGGPPVARADRARLRGGGAASPLAEGRGDSAIPRPLAGRSGRGRAGGESGAADSDPASALAQLDLGGGGGAPSVATGSGVEPGSGALDQSFADWTGDPGAAFFWSATRSSSHGSSGAAAPAGPPAAAAAQDGGGNGDPGLGGPGGLAATPLPCRVVITTSGRVAFALLEPDAGPRPVATGLLAPDRPLELLVPAGAAELRVGATPTPRILPLELPAGGSVAVAARPRRRAAARRDRERARRSRPPPTGCPRGGAARTRRRRPRGRRSARAARPAKARAFRARSREG